MNSGLRVDRIRQMAEKAGEICNDQEEQKPQVDQMEENDDASLMKPDSYFLVELNLVMIIASLSLSDQELSEYEDMEELKQQEDFKAFVSKLHARKRGFDELKVPDRRASRSRLQTKVLDSRHGRKV